MRKWTKLENVDWGQVQKEHNEGLFWLDLVKKFKISRTLLYKAQKLGLLTKINHKFKWSEADKERISKQRVDYLKEHPEKVPYLLNHSSKESYPEKYFNKLFENEGILLKRHRQIGLYQLDFYNYELKIDIEIDGDQHHLDSKIIESDKRRTEFLESLGWKVFRIRWSDYQKLSYNEKEKLISDISRNLIKEKEPNGNKCLDCQKEIHKRSLRCINCSSKLNQIKNRKFEISKEELEELIKQKPFTQIGKMFNVSDNAIRARARKMGVI